MKPYSCILIAIVIAGSLCSMPGCKKKEYINGVGKVKTKQQCSSTSCRTTTYTYDEQNRLHSSQSDQSAPVIYTYFKDSICTTDNNHSTYILNNTGLAVHLDLHYANLRESYTYNTDGFKTYLVGATDQRTSFLISGQDIKAEYLYRPIQFGGSSADDTTYHTYYSDLENRDYGTSFLGKSNFHLVKTDTTSWHSADRYGNRSQGLSTHYHTYSFDDLHRVVQENIMGSDTTTIYFSYY